MGCSAGKHVSASPELSTNTQISNVVTSFPNQKENGWTNSGVVDMPPPRNTAQTIRRNSKKDSTQSSPNNSECDVHENASKPVLLPKKVTPVPVLSKLNKEKDNGNLLKKNTQNRRNTDDLPSRPQQIGQQKMMLTQSQTDFFTMLDRKIEAGEDYISDTGER
ncbi:uncharacterized protein LOC5509769 [Nematostella vectensis]|uniref:uncharacterized protein LOC5509769 n=1 Tax=Nematostella vectensis TaxID=45351 RepID=UPI0020771353|nr:uncharacterized protein LOC5509769 [Nematostella vectensis]XP_032234599.2 uncharacterized protein LOC5509769 [Nematostella vectensis]